MLLQYNSMPRRSPSSHGLPAPAAAAAAAAASVVVLLGELRFIQNEVDMPNSMDRARALIIADKQFPI
jgi:hypothetical protein